MANKDEYEVARLYTDGSFQRQLAREFEGWEGSRSIWPRRCSPSATRRPAT